MNSISCILPAAKTNIENLNLRKFQNTSLLELKVNSLKKIDFSEIIVSTNDKSILNYLDSDIKIDIRKDELCVENVNFNEIIKYYCKITKFPIIFHSTINSPFVSLETMEKLIHLQQKNKYDTVCVIKKNTNKFFRINNIIRKCDMDNILLNVGLVFNKEKYLESGNLFSGNYIFLEIEELECIIIKSSLDFIIAESLYYREFNKQYFIDNYMSNSRFKKTRILDCTIRDSGYLNNWNWSYEIVKNFVYYMGKIGVEYCEIGFLMDQKYVEDNVGIWRHINSDFSIISKLKSETKSSVKIVVMLDVGNIDEYFYDFENMPEQKKTNIDLIRICCFYKILEKTKKVIDTLNQKGYKLTLNIMYSSHLNKKEINHVKDFVKGKPLEYLYFADSIGGLCGDEINNFFINLKSIYPIKNGFHNHDNNGTVFNNINNLLKYNIDLIDVTLSGYGKNGGNCSFELIMFYLIIKLNYQYDINYLLLFLEKIKTLDCKTLNLDTLKIKEMIQQYLNIHPSHTIKYQDYNLLDYYDNICNIKQKTKW